MGAAKRTKYTVETADTRQSAKCLKRLLVRFGHVAKLETVVGLPIGQPLQGVPVLADRSAHDLGDFLARGVLGHFPICLADGKPSRSCTAGNGCAVCIDHICGVLLRQGMHTRRQLIKGS